MNSLFYDKTLVHFYLFNDRTVIALDQSKKQKKPRLMSILENSKSSLYATVEIPDNALGQLTGQLSQLSVPTASTFTLSEPADFNSTSPTLKRNNFGSSAHDLDRLQAFDACFAIISDEEVYILESNKKEEVLELLLKNEFKKCEEPLPKHHFDFAKKTGSGGGSIRSMGRKSILERKPALSAPEPEENAAAVNKTYDLLKSTSEKLSAKEGIQKGEHQFVLYTYASAAWCDHCKDFIWGFKKQGYKCKVCYYDSHEKCLDKIKDPCVKPEEDGKDTLRRKSYAGSKKK